MVANRFHPGFSDGKTSENSDLNAVLKLLRIVGLGPFLLDKANKKKRTMFILFLYNVCLAASLVFNIALVVIGEKVFFGSTSSESVLTRISYDAIDMMENFHHVFISIRSLMFWRRGQSLWMNLVRVCRLFEELKVNFDRSRFRVYLWTKTTVLVFFYAVVLPIVFVVFPRPGSSGPRNLPFLCGLPLFLNSILETALGAITLILYQRFWIVNEFLNTCIDHYKEEKLLLDNRFRGFKPFDSNFKMINFEFLDRKQKPEKSEAFEGSVPVIKKAPLMVMMKNPEVVFASSFYRRVNIVEFIRKLKALHFSLYEVTDSVNSVFGFNLLFIFLTSFFGCIINLYFVVILHINQTDVKRYISCWCWMIYYFFRVVHIVSNANKSSREASRTQDLLHSFLNEMNFADTTIQEELKGFCPQITECRVEFKAAGFFSIDSSTFFQFVAGVFSNVVFVIQFDKT